MCYEIVKKKNNKKTKLHHNMHAVFKNKKGLCKIISKTAVKSNI